MRRRDERGLSDSVQWAILTPLLLLTVLGLIQGGIWLHGRDVAVHAAIAAAEEGALFGASEASARNVAARITDAGGLADVTIDVSRGTERVRVVVSGRMPTFVDLGQTRVSEQATRPVEQVTVP